MSSWAKNRKGAWIRYALTDQPREPDLIAGEDEDMRDVWCATLLDTRRERLIRDLHALGRCESPRAMELADDAYLAEQARLAASAAYDRSLRAWHAQQQQAAHRVRQEQLAVLCAAQARARAAGLRELDEHDWVWIVVNLTVTQLGQHRRMMGSDQVVGTAQLDGHLVYWRTARAVPASWSDDQVRTDLVQYIDRNCGPAWP